VREQQKKRRAAEASQTRGRQSSSTAQTNEAKDGERSRGQGDDRGEERRCGAEDGDASPLPRAFGSLGRHVFVSSMHLRLAPRVKITWFDFDIKLYLTPPLGLQLCRTHRPSTGTFALTVELRMEVGFRNARWGPAV